MNIATCTACAVGAIVASWLWSAGGPPTDARRGSDGGTPVRSAPASDPQDPALLRRDLLARLDARIEATATQAHLDARLSLDEVVPIPYLGVDADPVPGGVKITNIYPLTAASRAGLQVGDVLVSLDGIPTDSKAALARAVRGRRIGADATILLKRGDAALTKVTALGPRPEEDEDEEEQFPDLPPRFVATTEVRRFDLSATAPGAVFSDADAMLGGHGRPSRWVVMEEGGTRFLRQAESDQTGIHFPMAIARGFAAKDATVTARFRYVGGVVDRAAGVVLRYQDPGNYLVARANAAEADLRIFRVAGGMRRTLPGAIVKCPTDGDRWHTIEFTARGTELVATVDGTATTHGVDSYFLQGRAGLWTKSDSVTDFADVVFTPLPAVK